MTIVNDLFLPDNGSWTHLYSPFSIRTKGRLVDTLLAIHLRDLRLAIDLLLREEPGINVIGVASETEGLLALLKTFQPDLILLDWDLPGRALPKILKKMHAAARPPKLVVLGNEEDERETVLESGADAFLLKGEPPEQLLAAIHELR